MLAELCRRHVAEELQFGNLADATDLLGRHPSNKGLQVVRDVVEDLLVRVLATVSPLRIRRNACLRAVTFRVPVPASGIFDGDLQLHVFAVRFLDAATDDDVCECFARRDHPHRAPVTGSLQRRLQVIRNVAGLGAAYFLVNAGIRRIVVLRYTVVEFDHADIEQQGLMDGIIRYDELSFLGGDNLIDSAALSCKKSHGD